MPDRYELLEEVAEAAEDLAAELTGRCVAEHELIRLKHALDKLHMVKRVAPHGAKCLCGVCRPDAPEQIR